MHFHLATHILDAPRLDEASNEEVVQFVDKYVSCCLPDEETQNDLYKLVTELNTHKHTKTCKNMDLNVDLAFLGHCRQQH